MNRAFSALLATAILLPLPALAGDANSPNSSEKMTPQTRIAVMRDLTAERVFVRTVFPRGERGLELKDGKVTPDNQRVAQLVMEHGFAAKPGDRVVISNVEVREKSIVIEINGGGKKHEKWYQHVSVGMNGGSVTPGGAPKSLEATGSSLTLEFDKYIPEMTGNQVRELLAPVFDFKALTEAEAYERTLPPKVRAAIKNHQVLVGMDRDMVVYAKGRAPKKIRDKDDNGVDYEEWIYGNPPEQVEFVRFTGPFVTRLEIMTVDGQKIVRTQKEVDLQSQETEVAQKKDEPKPASAPTLRRPGEVDDSPQAGGGGGRSLPNTPLPPPVSTTPLPPPGSGPVGPN
ncbi:MAG TPA: hypothetical protein VFB04_07975 [Terriglobales bacterium]|nr:hypothetical protein [Terriglobales bacterium]